MGLFGKKKESDKLNPNDIVGFWLWVSYSETEGGESISVEEDIDCAHVFYVKNNGEILTDIFDKAVTGKWELDTEAGELDDDQVMYLMDFGIGETDPDTVAIMQSSDDALLLLLTSTDEANEKSYVLMKSK